MNLDELTQQLKSATDALRQHVYGCNRCFQGIYCQEKNNLWLQIVTLEQELKERDHDRSATV